MGLPVFGDVDRTFANILAYGPGFGSIGISVGCFRINKLGGAEVRVGRWAGAARNLGYIFGAKKNVKKRLL